MSDPALVVMRSQHTSILISVNTSIPVRHSVQTLQQPSTPIDQLHTSTEGYIHIVILTFVHEASITREQEQR
jgi:hypothetical protein